MKTCKQRLTPISTKKQYCLGVVVDATYESCVENEDATEKLLIQTKLSDLQVMIAMLKSFRIRQEIR